jgi:protein translocase SecG subunit
VLFAFETGWAIVAPVTVQLIFSATDEPGERLSFEWAIIPLTVLLILLSLFMILLILIQRGKGGGLAGAFGGAGGSSAFGSRAGDTFTKVTLYVAVAWLLLVMILIKIVPQVPTPEATGNIAPIQSQDDNQ